MVRDKAICLQASIGLLSEYHHGQIANGHIRVLAEYLINRGQAHLEDEIHEIIIIPGLKPDGGQALHPLAELFINFNLHVLHRVENVTQCSHVQSKTVTFGHESAGQVALTY